MDKVILGWDDVIDRSRFVAGRLERKYYRDGCLALYGVPRGGIYVCLLVFEELMISLAANSDCMGLSMVERMEEATVFIDDIIDTGRTRERVGMKCGEKPFFALVDKLGKDKAWQGRWVSFPWERMSNDEGPVENIRRLIQYIGDDPEREGLRNTPERVIRSYEKLFGGYKQNPGNVISVFEDDACDEMVLVKDIEFYSTCEHHMLPFYGKAHIAYIPAGKVIGVSKLARILEIYARRLQIQERLCQQVTEAIDDMVRPKGSACILEAQHFCMTARGIEKQNSIMVTSSLTGSFKEKQTTRNELISLIGRKF